jgi:hypothetical protein
VTKALPPGKKGGPIVGTKGGALAKQAKPSGNFRAPSLPKGTVKVAGKALSTLGKVGRGLGVAGAALGAADTVNSIVNPRSEGNQQLAKAMAAVNRRYSGRSGTRFKNPNTGTVVSKGAKPKAPMPKGSSEALREKSYASLQKFTVPKSKAAAKPAVPKAATTPSRSSAPARTPASRPAAKPKAPASMATESSLSASDIMKGYGMRVNQTFGAESAPTPKKRQSLREQTADIKKMIEESKKRQGKG